MNETPDKIRDIIGKMLEAEQQGRVIPDHRVLARHPGLKQELPEALNCLDDIREAEVQSQAAGALEQAITVCTDEELMAPIEGDFASSEGLSDDRELAPELTTDSLRDAIRNSIVGYELLEPLGRGGQATVYRATKLSTGGLVAIKILPGGYFATTRARARFEREAEALVRVNHPNVVPVYDKGRTRDGSLFIVMRYVEGLTLDRYLAGERDIKLIAALFAKIASAVAELHRCGIIHRDLKPSNVMVDRHGEPQVLDFGLAHVARTHGVTDTGQVLGSLPWTSPEQASGRLQDVNQSSDIYCLGVMLAFILDGRLPYPDAPSPMEAARHICSTPAQVGRNRKPAPLDGVALKCLAKQPTQRYTSALQLAGELRLVAAGEPPLLCTVRRRAYSRWLIAFVTLVALIAALTGVIRATKSRIAELNTQNQPPQEESVIELPSMTNSLRMKFVKIPAGTFTMGSPPREHGRDYWEEQRQVQISQPFYLGVTEITQGVFEHVTGKLPANVDRLGPDFPVGQVSYQDAIDFCRLLSLTDSHRYRLPTEAEWEYACRASSDAKPLAPSALKTTAWYRDNSDARLHPVATLKPNRWGLYDMLGGVSEWTADIVEPQKANTASTDAFGIIKGGGFDLGPESCRNAYRRSVRRIYTAPDLGFRVILEP